MIEISGPPLSLPVISSPANRSHVPCSPTPRFSFKNPSLKPNSAVATGLGKVSFHSNPKEGQYQRMFKLPHSCTHLTCSKFSKPDFNSMWTEKLWIFKLDLEKAEELEVQLPTAICWIIEKARQLQKKIYFWFIDYAKAFDCVDYNKLWKILQEMGMPDHLTCFLRSLSVAQEATVRIEHGTMNWFQIGKRVHQSCILSPAYLTSMQSTSCEMPGWRK